MTFKRARSKEQVEERTMKIVASALLLYDRDGYQAVTFKDISELTGITRPAIYSYFKNPDEILLCALGHDFDALNSGLGFEYERHNTLDDQEFAKILYDEFIKYPRMLKMLAINYSVIEVGASDEALFIFKSKIMQTFRLLGQYLEKFFMHITKARREDFCFIFFSFLSSVYILTHPSAKQSIAIKRNDSTFNVPSFEHLFFEGIRMITRSLIQSCK